MVNVDKILLAKLVCGIRMLTNIEALHVKMKKKLISLHLQNSRVKAIFSIANRYGANILFSIDGNMV